MPEQPEIPPRSAEWETPFSPVAPVNADADATRLVGHFSGKRRAVAIVVTILLAAWVIAEVVHVIQFLGVNAGTENLALGAFNYLAIFFRLGVSALIGWVVWRWAQKPVAG